MTGPRLLVAAVALAFAAPVRAQDTGRLPRPVAAPAPAFRFPQTRLHTLDNGLRVVVAEDHSVPVVSVRAVLRADSTRDPAGKEGLFAVTLGALREGSTMHTGDWLAAAAAAIGTNVGPTGFTTVSSAFAPALDLTAEMLTRPAFDSAAIERRKAAQVASARRLAQAPATIPRRLFYALMYSPGDPFVRSLLPTDSTIGSIRVADVAAFYARNFAPQGTTVVVAGDVTDSAAVAAVRRAFGSWRARDAFGAADAADAGPVAPAARRRPTTIYLRDAPGPQAYVYIGDPGPTRLAPDLAAAEAMGVVAATRFQQTLREKRSFMYSGTTGFAWRRNGDGVFVGSTIVSALKVDSALVEWLAMLRGLRTNEPVTPTELGAAVRNRVGSLPSRIDGPDSIAARLVEIARDGLPGDYFERYATTMSAVTPADVAGAAARYIDVDHLVIVVSGDRSVIEPALRAARIAPVVLVDGSGRPVP